MMEGMNNHTQLLSQQQQQQQHPRRLVIFVGPPKTASTTLESFFATHASDDNMKRKSAAFSNWTYPYISRYPNSLKFIIEGGPPSNNTHPRFQQIQAHIRGAVQRSPDKSILLGTEHIFDPLFDSNDLIDHIVNWTTPVVYSNNSSNNNVTTASTSTAHDDSDTTSSTVLPSPATPITPEIVVLYRSPRMSYLMSLWKQWSQQKGSKYFGFSFRDLMCDQEWSADDDNQMFYHLLNPLELVYRLSVQNKNKSLPTFLIDMGGVAASTTPPLDITHVFACDVLNVPCDPESSQILGLEGEILHSNSRSGDANITEAQRDALEEVFTLRDCTYYDQLRDHPMVTILHRHKLWDQDCPNMEPQYRSNFTIMLDRMKQILECPGSISGSVTPLDEMDVSYNRQERDNNETYDEDNKTRTTPTTSSSSSSEYIPESQQTDSQPDTLMRMESMDNHTQLLSQQQQHPRRLVVFVGPPKTASTTLESFFAAHASDDNMKGKSAAFSNWTYPYISRYPNSLKFIMEGGPPSNNTHPRFQEIQAHIRGAVQRSPDKSILLGTEHIFDPLFDSNDLIDHIVNWTTPVIYSNNSSNNNVTTASTSTAHDDSDTTSSTVLPSPATPITPEIVVLYRSPRMSYLMSLWKQWSQQKGSKYFGFSFRDLMCDQEWSANDDNQAFYRLLNPLELVYRLSVQNKNKSLSTFLIDMGGVAASTTPPLDITHVFACDVLNVPCDPESSQILGLEGEILHSNSRSGDANITEAQRDALEEVFTLRDCTYYDQLRDHPMVTILHRHKLWDQDCPNMEPQYRSNFTIMLDRMKQILECPGSSSASVTPLDEMDGSYNRQERDKNETYDEDNKNRTTTSSSSSSSSEYIPESQRIGTQPTGTTTMNSLPSLLGWRLEAIQMMGAALLLTWFWRRGRHRLMKQKQQNNTNSVTSSGEEKA